MDPNSLTAMLQKFLAMFKGTSPLDKGTGFITGGPGGTSLTEQNAANPSTGTPTGPITPVGNPIGVPPIAAKSPIQFPAVSPPAGGGGTNAIEGAGNTALSIGSMIPGPQQPFVAGAAMLAPIAESMLSGKNTTQNTGTMAQKAPVPPATPLSLSIPAASGPRLLPTVGSPAFAGPSGGSSQPSMAALIQALMKLRGQGV